MFLLLYWECVLNFIGVMNLMWLTHFSDRNDPFEFHERTDTNTHGFIDHMFWINKLKYYGIIVTAPALNVQK